MGGMEMMMKSFGIDPEAMKKDVQQTVTDLKQAFSALNERMSEVENQLKKLNEGQAYIISLLENPNVVAQTHANRLEKINRQIAEG